MSSRYIQRNNISSRSIFSSPNPWIRNPSWLTLPSVVSADEKFVGLYRINQDANFAALTFSTSTGSYLVDWGDGTTSTTASGSTSYHEYTYVDSGSVTFTDTGDLVTRTAHGYANGTAVYFSTITTTTGITVGTVYYVISATANTFQVSATRGGAAVALTNNGTGTIAGPTANTDAPVTFTDTGDLVNRTAHGYANGAPISFATIVSTTGITVGQIYYVVNATTNTFQVSLTNGGTAVALTTNGTGTILPYKQVIVKVTPVTNGATFTNCTTRVLHNQSGLPTNYSTGWLDIALSGSYTTLTINSSTPLQSNLMQINVIRCALTSFVSVLSGLSGLMSVVNFTSTATVTTTSSMFSGCSSLTAVPLFNTASVTNASSMFQNCKSLTSVPMFNFSSVVSMATMFQNCFSLTTVPLFNTSSVTTMNTMFSGCSSLTTVPLFNTASVTIMSSMFSNCLSLTTVPLFNTAAVSVTAGMFNGCTALTTVPMFNTVSVTDMSNMFNGCAELVTVPLFNTAATLTMATMFQGCLALASVPLFTTTSVTNMSNMFSGCISLTTIPLFNTASVTTMSGMFNACTALTSVPALSAAALTDSTSMFSGCSSLSVINIVSMGISFSVASCKLSGAQLDNIYTNLPSVSAKTITVTGNYGISIDTPTIATAKGWTVTGS